MTAGDIATDQLIVADADGVLKTLPANSLESGPWDNPDGTVANQNSTDINYTEGHIGIGTTAPTTLVQAYGTDDTRISIDGDGTSGFGGFELKQNGVFEAGIFYAKSSGETQIYGNGRRVIRLQEDDLRTAVNPDAKRVRVEGSLITTTTQSLPTERNPGSYVYTDQSYGMELMRQNDRWALGLAARNDSDIRLGHYAGNESEQQNFDTKMIVRNTGRVGIGTSTPEQALDVRGNVAADQINLRREVDGVTNAFITMKMMGRLHH